MPITLDGSTGITDADGGTVLNTNDFASQAQAQAGTNNTTVMTPLRSAQAIAALATIPAIASQAQAEAGTDNTTIITPLRVRNALNATGSAPIYACRAWVNFNGTGTVAIRASGNVSSITDNGTGNYTVNFSTAMPTADYCALVTSIPKGTGNNVNFGFGVFPGGTKTVSAVQVAVGGASNATGFTIDYDQVNVAVFC